MIKFANKALQFFSTHRKLSFFLFAPLAIIVLILFLYIEQIWPFGQGYFVNFMKAKDSYVKSVDEEARNHPATALHRLDITRFKDVEQGHLSIFSQNENEIRLALDFCGFTNNAIFPFIFCFENVIPPNGG